MAFAIITCSPVNTLVTDPRGRQIGLDLTTGAVINEIPGAAISDLGTEPHIILVPQVPGEYQVQSVGTNTGDYKVIALGIVENDKKPKLMGYMTGTITISETDGFTFNVPSLVHLPIILK